MTRAHGQRRASAATIPPAPEAEAKVAKAFAKLIATTRANVVKRLHASGHTVASFAATPQRKPGQGEPYVVDDPAALFSVADWTAGAEELAPVLGAIVVDSASQSAIGYAFDVTDRSMVDAVAKRVGNIAGWGDDMASTVADVISRGMAEGWSVRDMTDALTERGSLSDAAAERIARTESLGAANLGTLEGWKAVGVETKIWLASDGACPDCADLDGEEVGVNESFSDGSDLPPDPHPACRCTLLSGEPTDDSATTDEGAITSGDDSADDTSDNALTASASTKEQRMARRTTSKPRAALTVVTQHSTEVSRERWDLSGHRSRVRAEAEPAYYRALYGQRNPDIDSGQASAWRFLHHEVGGDGSPGPANHQACVRVIGMLNGSGRGVGGVEEDRRGMYDHMARHIRDGGGSPPAFRLLVPAPEAAASNGRRRSFADTPAMPLPPVPEPDAAPTGYQPEPYRADPDETVQCPNCKLMNDTDASFCDQCGFQLTPTTDYRPGDDETVECPFCQKMNDTDAIFCDQCCCELKGAEGVLVDGVVQAAVAAQTFAPAPAPIPPAAPAVGPAPAPSAPAPAPTVAPGGSAQTSAMVALFPDDPAPLAVDGGDIPAELHLTVLYLGEAADLGADGAALVRSIVADFAADYVDEDDQAVGTISGTAFAVSTFSGDSDSNKDPAQVLLVQSEDLDAVEDDLIDPLADGLEDAGIPIPDDHPIWFPHITIGRGIDPSLLQPLIGTEVTFSSISVCIGDQRIDYKLGEPNDDAGNSGADADGETTPAGGTGGPEGIPTGMASRGGLHAEAGHDDDGSLWQATDDGAWEGVLIVETVPSGDGRLIAAEALTWRTLPLPLMVMFRNSDGGEGHAGAELCGNITRVWRDGNEIWGSGTFNLKDEVGRKAYDMVRDGYLRGVSADLDMVTVEFENEAEEPDTLDDLFNFDPGMMIVTAGRLMGATALSFPAYQEATIRLLTPGSGDDMDMPALVASAAGAQAQVFTPITREARQYALVASAGFAGYPVHPPAAWFAKQQLDGPTPVHITPEGRIYGHPWTWTAYHIGFGGQKRMAPRSHNDYADFQHCGGQVLTAEGTLVNTGPLIMDSVHPDLALRASDAHAFYAHTGSAIADVHVYEDAFGSQICGSLRPTATPEQVRAARGSDWSPDWRPVSGPGRRYTVVAMLAVNNSGFKTHEALVASAGGVEKLKRSSRPGRPRELVTADGDVLAMVATGMLRRGHRGAAAEMRAEMDDLWAAIRPLRKAHALTIAQGLRSRSNGTTRV